MQLLKRFRPILTAIGLQLLVLIGLLILIQGLWHGFSITLSLWEKVGIQAVGAVLISYIVRLPMWWIFIQFITPFALVLAITFNIPTWVYPLAFFALLMFYWNSADERVPLYLSNKTTWKALGDLLEKDLLNGDSKPIHFIDLGCGFSGTLVTLAKRFPRHTFTGVETAPLPYLVSLIRCQLSGLNNVHIQRKSLWDVDLSNYECCYAFLSPEPMPRLYKKIISEMPKGSNFISNSFTVPEHPPMDTRILDDRRQTELHIWKIN
ncbi:hypothetical protein [Kiloniella sp.]|uniref:hypothetical protein n=1 Tax=Kiloniella sp. TaxID=1938587 RepID=UPI003B01CDC4